MYQPRSRVEQALRDDEELLWIGRSDPARMFVDADRYLIPFSALFTAGVVAALVTAARSNASAGTLVLLSVFVLIGLHLLGGRFLVKRYRKLTNVYAVTDRRVLITNQRRLLETDVRRTDWFVVRTGRHITVEWDDTSHLDTLFWGGSTAVRQYANTGLDRTAGPAGNFALFDVADGDALLDALERASGQGRSA